MQTMKADRAMQVTVATLRRLAKARAEGPQCGPACACESVYQNAADYLEVERRQLLRGTMPEAQAAALVGVFAREDGRDDESQA